MRTLLLLALVASIPSSLFADAKSPSPWHSGLDHRAIETSLYQSPVQSLERLDTFLTREKGRSVGCNPDYMLATLADGTRAVYRSEPEAWGSQAEVAGYNMSRALEMDLVPPTVKRTLERDQTLSEAEWPWPEARRMGSMQLYVESHSVHGPPPTLSAKAASDIQVLSFVMGRYDNHADNILYDAAGAPILIDFENSLEVQQARYGDYPFVRRGRRYTAAAGEGVSSNQPFPFDSPLVLSDPSLETIQKTFGPWWTHWVSGMNLLHRLLNSIPGRRIPYAFWGDHLYVQVRTEARHPAFTREYSRRTLENLRQMTRFRLGRDVLLTPPYRPAVAAGILDRAQQVLAAADKGRMVP